MDIAHLRDRLRRQERLDEEGFHLFALNEMVRVLRTEDAYESNGQTGLILLKTDHLRIVLEVVQAGTKIGLHTVRGPTVIQVLEGSLCLKSMDETRNAHAGEMVVIPHDRPRDLKAEEDTAFVWALSI